MEQIVQSVTLAPVEAFNMAWEVLSHRLMSRLLGDDSPAMLVCDFCAQAARRCSR